MAIRPLDMQTMIPKTTEVSRLQQIEQQRPSGEQQQFGQQLQKQVQQNSQQVIQTNSTEKQFIQKDRGKGSNPEGKNRKGKKDGGKPDTKKRIEKGTSIIDIRI